MAVQENTEVGLKHVGHHRIWDITHDDIVCYGSFPERSSRRQALGEHLESALEHAQWWLQHDSDDVASIPPFLLALSLLSRCHGDIGRKSMAVLLASLQGLPQIRASDVGCLFSLARDFVVRMSNGIVTGTHLVVLMSQGLEAIWLRLTTHAFLGELSHFESNSLVEFFDKTRDHLDVCFEYYEAETRDLLIYDLHRSCFAGMELLLFLFNNQFPSPSGLLQFALHFTGSRSAHEEHFEADLDLARLLLERLEEILSEALTENLHLALGICEILFEISQCPNSTIAAWALQDHPCSLWSIISAIKSGYVTCPKAEELEAIIIAYIGVLRDIRSSVSPQAQWLYSTIPMNFPHIKLSLLRSSNIYKSLTKFHRGSLRSGGAPVLSVTLLQALLVSAMHSRKESEVNSSNQRSPIPTMEHPVSVQSDIQDTQFKETSLSDSSGKCIGNEQPQKIDKAEIKRDNFWKSDQKFQTPARPKQLLEVSETTADDQLQRFRSPSTAVSAAGTEETVKLSKIAISAESKSKHQPQLIEALKAAQDTKHLSKNERKAFDKFLHIMQRDVHSKYNNDEKNNKI